MPLSDFALDNGLAAVAGTRRLDITHTLATTYAEATTDAGTAGGFSLGNKAGLVVPAPVARTPNGRKVTVPAVTDGVMTETTTSAANDAAFWALSDVTNSRVLCTGPLSATQYVTDGNTFSTPAFDIGIPNQ